MFCSTVTKDYWLIKINVVLLYPKRIKSTYAQYRQRYILRWRSCMTKKKTIDWKGKTKRAGRKLTLALKRHCLQCNSWYHREDRMKACGKEIPLAIQTLIRKPNCYQSMTASTGQKGNSNRKISPKCNPPNRTKHPKDNLIERVTT